MFIRNVLFTAVSAATLGLTGCLDSGGQTNNNANPEYRINGSLTVKGTHPLFDPLKTEFVIPSDALFGLSEVNDGTMLNGTDPANPVTQGIGFLDGASVLAPIDVKISASLDSGQTLDAREFVLAEDGVTTIPNPNQNVFLIPVDYAGGDALQPLGDEAPGLTTAARYRQALRLQVSGGTDADGNTAEDIFAELRAETLRVELLDIDGGQNNLVRVLPLTPLEPKTKYVLALTNDIVDAQGEPLVGSPTYQSVANPDRVLSNGAFQPFRDAMLPARNLAADYFDFKRESEDSAEFDKTFADVTYATTITTTAVDDVLLANAAPVTYYLSTLKIAQRQEELAKVIDGFYNLSDQTVDGATTEEQALKSALYTTLTDENYKLYNAELAAILEAANTAGDPVFYADVVADVETDRRLAHGIQVAAAQATDASFETSIEAEAQTLAMAAEEILDTPKARNVKFFSQRRSNTVNPALQADVGGSTLTVKVYEGVIDLPYFQSTPAGEDGDILKTSSWSAADFSGSETLESAPSNRVTYRFPFAASTETTTVPIIVAGPQSTVEGPLGAPVPSPTPPPTGGNGYPVIIYQHAATQDRSAILPLATAAGLTCAGDPGNTDCFVTIGIDQPLHGIFDRAGDGEDGAVGLNPISEQRNDLPEGVVPADATERHFGFTANADLEAVTPSELADPKAPADEGGPSSGSLFLNFANYANTRDNMRQGALDLMNVNASLEAIEGAIAACQTAGNCSETLDIDPSRVYFMTHSLSGMGGVAFHHVTNAAIEANTNAGIDTDLKPISASVFFNTGGMFTRLVENSQSVAPLVLPGLFEASEGILAQGRTELNIYFNVFQGLLDSADPAAFAPLYEDKPVLLTEINGEVGDPDDADRPTDGTIPNAADAVEGDLTPLSTTIAETGFVIKGENMPLAGTDPMAAVMGATSTSEPGATLPLITRYLEGSHGNPISAGNKAPVDPYSSSVVFSEMTAELLELFSLGAPTSDDGLTVDFPCVVEGADTTGTDCSDPEQSDPGK